MNTKRSIIFISLVVVMGLLFINGCTTKSSESRAKEVSYEAPEIKRDTNLGTELPFIVYESDKQVVFYNYMGIFIYDLNSSKMINAIKPLDSKFKIKTQGDQSTSVDFDIKENTVIIYQVGNEKSDYFYKFNITSDKLYQYPIDEFVQDQEQYDISGKMDTTDWNAWNLIYTSDLTGESYYLDRLY